MALEKQRFTLPLAQGMSQKSDPKTLTGGLTLVENAVYRKDKRIQKRAGWTSLVKTLASGGSLSSADAAAVYENELVIWSGNHLYTWSSAQSKWYDRGPAYSVAVDTKQVIASNTSYGTVDSVYAEGVVLVAYEYSVYSHYQVYDYETGAILKSDTDLDSGNIAQRPKCVTISSLLFVIYSNTSSEIKGAIISPVTGEITSTVTIASNLGLISVFDVLAVASDTIMLAYLDTSGNIAIKYLNSSLGARGGTYSDSTTAGTGATKLRLIDLGSAASLLVYIGSAANVQARLVSATGSVGTALDTTLAKTISSVSAAEISGHKTSTANVARIYVQFTASDESNNFIWYADVSTVGGSNTSWEYLRSVGLATRGFVKDGVGYVGLFHKSDLQSTFFIADENGVIVSRHQPGTGGAGATNNAVSSVWTAVTDKYEFAITNKTRVISITDTHELYTYSGSAAPSTSNLYSPLNVAVTSVDFQNNANFTAQELGGTLLVVGGVLSMYDGLSVVEHNFLLYPEGLTATSTAAGSVANGTYLYVAIYEWTDAKGLTHRSAPSIPLSHTVSAGPKTVDVVVPTLRLTMKKALGIAGADHIARAEVKIVLYRTTAGQTGPYYRATSITSPTENDTTSDSVTIQDNTLDSSLTGREILYTAGGVLDNVAASAAKYMKVWRGRVMLGGLEDGSIQYSKPVVKGAPVEFSAENSIDIESDGGPVTGFEILDDKLIVFKNDWPYVTSGDGPDALGLGGAFYPLERIATCEVGCIDQQSTCAIPGAVIFKSEKGWQMLARDLSAAYIGGPIEDYDLSVTSATLFGSKSEVRITHSDGETFVYNYEFQRWSVFTNHEAVDGLRWNGSFVHIKSDGSVCVETEGTYRDDGTNYDVTETTGWQTLADIAGFQRIYRAAVLGDYKSPCTLTLKAAYDFDDTWYESGSFSLSAAAYRWQFCPARQKCEAVRFQIVVSVSESLLSGEGITLTAMSLLFGIKRGLSKLASASKAAMSTI